MFGQFEDDLYDNLYDTAIKISPAFSWQFWHFSKRSFNNEAGPSMFCQFEDDENFEEFYNLVREAVNTKYVTKLWTFSVGGGLNPIP